MICDGALTRAQQLKGQKLLHQFNLLNGFSYMCLGETVVILFAVKLACSNSLIAILGAMIQFAFILMPLGKIVTARIGAAQSQATFWVFRNFAAMLVASAAVWHYLGLQRTAEAAILIGSLFFYGFRAAGVVMARPLAGEFTVERERAMFFAKNTSAFHCTNLLALVLISIILHFTDSVWVLMGIILTGSCLGITSSSFFRKMDESKAIRDSARRPVWRELGHAWRNSHFRSLQYAQVGLAVTFVMLGPMSLLALKRGCNVSDMNALLYTIIMFGTATGMSWVAGRVILKIGLCKAMISCHAFRLLIPWFWIFMPIPYSPWLAVIPFLLLGLTGVVSHNAIAQYFLRALPVRSQVAAAMISALVAEALAGFIGMFAASGFMKLAEYLAKDSTDNYLQYQIYFMLAFVFGALVCSYPVLKIKRFMEKRA